MPYGGRGNRWMYHATGLPGWMRFGFSPGWVGRSPTGLGPCASYMMTGAWPTPQAQAYWGSMQSGQASPPYFGGGWAAQAPGFPGVQPGDWTPEQEIQMLRDQAEMLNQQLEGINSRISELEKSSTSEE